MSWDDKMKHLDPQVGSMYDLIAVDPGVTDEPTLYDAVRYLARTIQKEKQISGKWMTPRVRKMVEQPDTQKHDFGWHMTLTMTMKRPHSNPDEGETSYIITAILRQVSQEWFLVSYDLKEDRA
eukprot:NODE_6275_length_641_cov_4.339527_g5343_i0.p1 GENE.NODE_6275_length_641_cov_4.339527_g5343_i0~~NODE_6275_length_641_cov_4.339527_g5343_i0.p1  ORF type:complete len:123 (-),score=21.72 NODE_6275_length_641_cov_4.339527_g5343_i0:95-463(-)